MPASLSGKVVSFTMTDGGAFDRDGAADGNIADPSGVAVSATTSTAAIPALDARALLLLAMLVIAAAWRGGTRRA